MELGAFGPTPRFNRPEFHANPPEIHWNSGAGVETESVGPVLKANRHEFQPCPPEFHWNWDGLA